MRLIGSVLLVFVLCFVALLCTLTAVLIHLLPLLVIGGLVWATVKVLECRRRPPHCLQPDARRFPSVARVWAAPAPPAGAWVYLPVCAEDRQLPGPRYVDAFVIEGTKDG